MSICFACGQCCQSLRVSFYHGEVEGNGSGTVPANLVTQITPHLVCMKGTEKGKGRCIALTYTTTEGYRCSIYENRPSPCREFNVRNDDGRPNSECNTLRIAIGLDSVIASNQDN